MDFTPSPRAQDYLKRIKAFIRDQVAPVETQHLQDMAVRRYGGDWTQWQVSPEVERLKAAAREAGLWNLFLPDTAHGGAGLSNVEYASLAEEMGRSFLAPEVFNCNAPDTGNMEVLAKYGTADQQERWLKPLLAGEIRSAFCMTEPEVASSDATNMRATATIEGDEVVLNGRKWWSSGIGHPNCKVAIFMGLSDASAGRHQQHSMVLVPLDTPGVTIKRMLPVFGEYDVPFGHGEVWYDNVRLPASSVILGMGRGFEIAQGRLGPGRIHHCMRSIGGAERALELMIQRGLKRQAFGKSLVDLGGNRERVADLRIDIDQARLLTLYAAWKIDKVGAMAALNEIAAIKVAVPNMFQRTVDAAMQLHGAGGVSYDFPLTALYAQARVMRLVDGPDEVHRGLIARMELGKHAPKSSARGGASR